MRTEYIGNKIAHRSGERDGGSFAILYSIAARELHLMISSGIVKCVWHKVFKGKTISI